MTGKPSNENSKLRIIKTDSLSKLKMSEKIRNISKEIKNIAKFIKIALVANTLTRQGAYDQFVALREFKRQFMEMGGKISASPQDDIGMYCEELLISSYKNLEPPIIVETKYAIGDHSLFYRISKDIYTYLVNGRVNGAIFIIHDSIGEVDFNVLRNSIDNRFRDIFSVMIISSEEIMGTKVNSRANKLLFSFFESTDIKNAEWRTRDFDDFYSEKRLESYINRVDKFNITVFFGAGVSSSAGFPTWNGLIEASWWETARGRDKLENADNKYVLSKIDEIIGDSPLVKARMLQESQGESLFWRLRDLLYPPEPLNSPLVEESCRLIINLKSRGRLSQVMTLNYDNLIEEGLGRLGVDMPPFYGSNNIYDNSNYIFHVHGYLPPPPRKITQQEVESIVFSESAYNLLASNSYAATNIRILQRFIDDACIFLGHSMTDPNIRRLLEISQSVRMGVRHLWFKRLPDIDRSDWDKYIFNRQIANLQERIMISLGVHIIWYKDHADLPQIIKGLGEVLIFDR